MIELVLAPSVHLVAGTVISREALGRWAEAHNLHGVYDSDDTPLGILGNDLIAAEDGDIADPSLDALPEFGGRFCYRSFDKGRSRPDYIRNIIEMEHGSVLEHATVSFAVSGVSRSLTHELVRHRQGNSPSQESQRYVDASQIRFVVPPLLNAIIGKLDPNEGGALIREFEDDCERDLERYVAWRATYELYLGSSACESIKLGTMRKKRALEAARAKLPNAAETRLIWTMNMRSARFVCALRGGEGADLEIRRLACEFTRQLKVAAPFIFSDFAVYTADDGFEAVRTEHPKV